MAKTNIQHSLMPQVRFWKRSKETSYLKLAHSRCRSLLPSQLYLLCRSSQSLHSSLIALTLHCLALGCPILDAVHFFKVAVLRPDGRVPRTSGGQNDAIGHRKFFVLADLGSGNGE